MAINQNNMHGLINRNLLTTGAVLTGVGAMICLTGTALVGVALTAAGRTLVRRMETAPSERASRVLHQAMAASAAGREAWRAEAGNGQKA